MVVLPGIIDAHTHPADGARDQDKCNLLDEMLNTAAVKAKVAWVSRPGQKASAW